MEKAMQTAVSASTGLRAMPTATGHSVLLANDEFPLYHLHITRFMTDLRPEGQSETELVQRLADTEWRLNRLMRVEMGFYARGHVEFANLFAEQDPEIQSLLIEQQILCAYSRQLKDLALQESRLRRYATDDAARLACLQSARKEQEAQRVTPTLSVQLQSCSRPMDVTALPTSDTLLNGFDFSSDADCSFSTPLHSRPALAGHKSRRKGDRVV